MPSSVLFSNASFDKPAQATVLRSIESIKRKVIEDDTVKLYEHYCNQKSDQIEKKESLVPGKSILGSVDAHAELINTIAESQTLKLDITSNLKPSIKKRKLKIVANKIDVVKTVDAKNKTINFMTKVSVLLNDHDSIEI